MTEHVDVLIVGAGLSGIGAACHLTIHCKQHTYMILESRDQLGGTWDLFRYPGIRSDSDMYTLGFSFRPWREQKAIADGDSILRYLEETVDEYGVRPHMRFGYHVRSAAWSSEQSRWTVTATEKATGDEVQFTCDFLYMCSGYYAYAAGYTPDFEGMDDFGGEIVHPQSWTDDIEYAGKNVVVIGSGATAVTLVPELAKTAAHVTMLQRSPTYMASGPSEDAIANRLRDTLPPRLAYGIARWKNVLFGMAFFHLSRRTPERVKRFLVERVREQLPPGYDVEKHFTPYYNPWDQRLCLVTDGDLFEAINAGKVTVVTDHIERFTEPGLRLRSGATLEADLIITATGLQLQFLGGIEIVVDGEAVEPQNTMTYKAMMFSGVPNLALSFGYTNASWTLKSDLTAEYVCRLLNHMRRGGYTRCVAPRDPTVEEEPFLDFTSGYIQRAAESLPRQGDRAPWKLRQNYALDILTLRYGDVVDDTMQFS